MSHSKKEYYKHHPGNTAGCKLLETHKEKLITSKCKICPAIVSPNGEIFRNIFNFRKFCREQGLNETDRRYLARVLRGEHKQYKGWKLYIENINAF